MNHGGFVYILADKDNHRLYVGVTSDLVNRIIEHKEGKYLNSYTSKYKTHKIVYYEFHDEIETAIKREKQIKRWLREWKISLIKSFNQDFKDLFDEVLEKYS